MILKNRKCLNSIKNNTLFYTHLFKIQYSCLKYSHSKMLRLLTFTLVCSYIKYYEIEECVSRLRYNTKESNTNYFPFFIPIIPVDKL